MDMPKGVLFIQNNGQDILKTNYWDEETAESGRIFFSVNSGCIRLLLPDNQINLLPEIETGKEVIISRGPCPSMGSKDSIEFMFEDYSRTPFAIQTALEAFDMIPRKSKKWKFTGWSRAGKFYTAKKVRYRYVDSLPCRNPWGK